MFWLTDQNRDRRFRRRRRPPCSNRDLGKYSRLSVWWRKLRTAALAAVSERRHFVSARTPPLNRAAEPDCRVESCGSDVVEHHPMSGEPSIFNQLRNFVFRIAGRLDEK